MAKGKLYISRSNRGAWILSLDRLNGRAPMPLAYVRIEGDTHNGKACDYEMDAQGRITRISLEEDGQVLYPLAAPTKAPSADTGYAQPDSLLLAQTCLPQADFKHLELGDIDNFALKYHKAARLEEGFRHSYKFYFHKAKFRFDPGYKIRANYGDLDFADMAKRQVEVAKKLVGANSAYYATPQLKTAWRYVQGLGQLSVYETGLTLHQVYGCPYIPATIIKGILRAYIIERFFIEGEADDRAVRLAVDKAESDVMFRRIFGGVAKGTLPAEAGEVQFWDALPAEHPGDFELDVMNPHYPSYYGGRDAPTDTQYPVPITFLALRKKGVKFQFIYTANKALKSYQFQGISLEAIFRATLRERGLGAKTAIGYGYFD